jgi:hypothetical protein
VGYDPSLDGIYAYDPTKARQLLAKSKYGIGAPVTITASDPGNLPQQLQAQLQAVGFKATIETIPAAQATQIIYIQHSKALAVDQFAGRDSTAQAFQVLFGGEGLMNPSRTTSPELNAAVQKVVRTPLDDPKYPQVVPSQAELGRKAGIDRSDVTAALTELESRNLIERSADPEHKRRKIVTITAEGVEELFELDKVIDGIQDEFPSRPPSGVSSSP